MPALHIELIFDNTQQTVQNVNIIVCWTISQTFRPLLRREGGLRQTHVFEHKRFYTIVHSLGFIAISVLATAETPHTNPTGNRSGPDWSVPSSGKKTATCAAEAMARPAIKVLLLGREKLFSFAASCVCTLQWHKAYMLIAHACRREYISCRMTSRTKSGTD